MSLLSQIAPHRADTLTTIGIATASNRRPPDVALGPFAPQPEANTTVTAARDLTRTLLSDGCDDETLARLDARLDEYVDVWTPALHTSSRFEIVSALSGLDDAIGDVSVTFTESAGTGPTVFLAWRASGWFHRPAFLDDDHLLEPNGAVIRIDGTTSVSFTAALRADRIRCFYDRLTLIEQMLASHAVANDA